MKILFKTRKPEGVVAELVYRQGGAKLLIMFSNDEDYNGSRDATRFFDGKYKYAWSFGRVEHIRKVDLDEIKDEHDAIIKSCTL